MSRLETKRAANIDSEFSSIERSLAKVSSELKRDTDLVIQLTGWMHDNITNSKGDVDANDRADFNEKFTPIFANIQEQLNKLAECYSVYNDDPAIYAQNLADFIVKYPQAAAEIVEARFK